MKVRPAPMPARADVGAYAACAWSLAFAAVQLNWALGGTALLPPGMSVGMNPALFVIDVIAVPLCLLGALLALSFVRPWGRAFPRRALLACGWGVCAILVLHSASTLVRGALVAVGLLDADLSVLERWSLFVYEPWFFTGGSTLRPVGLVLRSEITYCGRYGVQNTKDIQSWRGTSYNNIRL